LTPNASTDGITVSHGSTVVWTAARSIKAANSALTLEGGKGVRLTTSWNGRSNLGGSRRLAPGVYTIQASEGGYTAMATIKIVG
jgi:hypothetical protein